MRKIALRGAYTAIALGLATAAQPALADHAVIYAPRTSAFASSNTHQGPNVVGSSINIVNGVAQPGYGASGGGGISGGGNPYDSWAETFQNGGFGDISLYSEASASASLTAGRLRATVGAAGPNFFGSPLGFAAARIDDTLFFTNTTGGDLAISFTYAFDGRLIDSTGTANPGGELGLILSCDYFLCYNGTGSGAQAIRFAGTGIAANSNMNYYFNEDTPSYFGENIYGGMNANFGTGLGAGSGTGGVVDGWITANLLIPTGMTSLGIRGYLNLDCRAGSSCDFGHTGQFSFGALPDGLTLGSASGVFLTAITPGGVPEPATWAFMILGFGGVASAMRRRSRTIRHA